MIKIPILRDEKTKKSLGIEATIKSIAKESLNGNAGILNRIEASVLPGNYSVDGNGMLSVVGTEEETVLYQVDCSRPDGSDKEKKIYCVKPYDDNHIQYQPVNS